MAVTVTIKVSRNHSDTTPRGAEAQMAAWLERAGFDGVDLTAQICDAVKATGHKRCQVRPLGSDGKVVRARTQPGSNDTRREYILTPPSGVSAAEFHRRLKATEGEAPVVRASTPAVVMAEEDVAPILAQPSESPPVVSIQDEETRLTARYYELAEAAKAAGERGADAKRRLPTAEWNVESLDSLMAKLEAELREARKRRPSLVNEVKNLKNIDVEAEADAKRLTAARDKVESRLKAVEVERKAVEKERRIDAALQALAPLKGLPEEDFAEVLRRLGAIK